MIDLAKMLQLSILDGTTTGDFLYQSALGRYPEEIIIPRQDKLLYLMFVDVILYCQTTPYRNVLSTDNKNKKKNDDTGDW